MRSMFLTLAHPGDRLAVRVHETLRARHGAGHVRLLTGEDLALGAHWALRQDGPDVRSTIRFAGEAELFSAEIGAVFNRLRFVAAPQFGESSVADREYAVMETHAFLVSWLASLACPVINRAGPRALGGDATSTAQWLQLATRAGLPARGMRFTSNSRRFPAAGYEPFVPLEGAGFSAGAPLRPASKAILGSLPAHFLEPVEARCLRVAVIGDQEYGGHNLPPELREGCLHLAHASGCALLELAFARSAADGGWRFCGANSFPLDLTATETEALIRLLEAGAAASAGCET